MRSGSDPSTEPNSSRNIDAVVDAGTGRAVDPRPAEALGESPRLLDVTSQQMGLAQMGEPQGIEDQVFSGGIVLHRLLQEW